MAYRHKEWRPRASRDLWLGMLMDGFEKATRAEARATPCDPTIMRAVRAQLACPISARPGNRGLLH